MRWRGSINSFVDCHGDKLKSTDLERATATEIGLSGASKGELLDRPAAPGSGATAAA